MIGIYKITNKLNGNSYIGLSVDIERRWKVHKQRYKYSSDKEYEKVLYKAFRKYGIENFDFSIVEECPIEKLREREKYWINYFNTFHKGYNATEGGEDLIPMPGEKHPNHKLTESDVIYIRQLWASKTLSTREMYYEYQHIIGKSGFKKIYTWQTWKKILPELNTEENRKWHRENLESYRNWGEKNPNALLTDKEYLQIKIRYKNGESLNSIFNNYKEIYKNYQSFYNSIKEKVKEINKPVSTILFVEE